MTDPDLHLAYAVRWRAGDARPGKHPARQAGIGGAIHGVRPFWQWPDARRIDVRRSITDPFETLMVRQMENTGSITLVLAADLSASMAAAPGGAQLPALAAAAGRSAHRAGDAFGFIGFDDSIRPELKLPPTRARGAGVEMAARLADARPGHGAAAIAELARHLPARRCLLLLVSDFLLPLDLLADALARLARHDVAPIVTRSDTALPRAGLLRLRDAESGRTRLLLLRPSLHRAWQRARAERRAALDALFARHCRPAFYIAGGLELAALGVGLCGV